ACDLTGSDAVREHAQQFQLPRRRVDEGADRARHADLDGALIAPQHRVGGVELDHRHIADCAFVGRGAGGYPQTDLRKPPVDPLDYLVVSEPPASDPSGPSPSPASGDPSAASSASTSAKSWASASSISSSGASSPRADASRRAISAAGSSMSSAVGTRSG